MEKIFCIGMFKTGTTSIGKALEKLGFKTFHGSRSFIDLGIDSFAWDPVEFSRHLKRVTNLVTLYDAFEDYPFMWIYREMHEAFPDAKFILTERDSRKVAESDINMWKQLGRHPIPDLQAFIDRYERHHDAVLEFFGNSEQLLRMQLGSGDEWRKLCDFLELPAPTRVQFPHSNARPYGMAGAVARRVGRRLKDPFRH